MVYFSFILSVFVLFFVIRLMLFQKRFDFFNYIIVTGALIVVLLDIDTLWSGRNYEITGFISLGVLILWFINMGRKPKQINQE